MIKKIYIFLTVICISTILCGQSDEDAINILDRFSSTATSAPSVSIDFNLVYEDILEDYNDTISGSVVLHEDKYKLELPDNIIWYDGTTSWSYLPEEYEVTITEPGQTDDIFTSRPSMIFSSYKEGYKCRLVEATDNFYVIDLYPEDPASDLIRLRLSLGKQVYNLISFEYKRKDGFTATLIAKKYDLSFITGNEFFTFSNSHYKNIDIIDMR